MTKGSSISFIIYARIQRILLEGEGKNHQLFSIPSLFLCTSDYELNNDLYSF